jgi:hypothetical protein
MSQDKPRARKSAQRDAVASGKRVMPKACFQHDDAAIGLSWLTPQGRGPFAPPGHAEGMLPACRKSLQTMEVCYAFAPAGSTKVLASMPIHL